MDQRTVLSALEDAFAVLRSVADWPDPRPDGASPPDEAYSRVTDPGRYLLVVERAEAWARALSGLGLAVRDDSPAAVTDLWRDPGPGSVSPSRSTRLAPTATGALPLLLAFSLPPWGARDRTADVDVGAGDPAVVVLESDCRCDACDFGSADLLRTLDDAVLHVVSGGLVHVAAPGLTAATTRSGWNASGAGRRSSVERLLAEAAAGRSRHRVVMGGPWW